MKAFCIAAASAITVKSELPDYYTVFESGREWGDNPYERVTPKRFATSDDDIFMRSMIEQYALEGKACEEDDAGKKVNCKPNGKFFLNEKQAKVAAKEVLATHKGLTGDALKTYLDTYWAKAWGHFDVNRSGIIEVLKAPQLMRFLSSDQRMSLGENGF